MAAAVDRIKDVPRYLVVLCLLFVPTFVSAQTTATISGTVQDSDGGVMPGVTVTATNAATSLVRTTVSNVEGRYVLAGLPPGEYELRAEIAGFTPQVRRGLPLTVAETVVANLTLQIGALEIRDEVIGVRPLVNTSSSELSYLVGTETIENLPLNGRNYTDLALLQPGVLAYPHRDGGSVVAHGLGISVNGQDPRANVYLLDGTLQNDFTNGPAGSAAGTSLGMETRPRIPRRNQRLRRGVRTNRRRADQRADQVGHESFQRKRATSITATTPSTRATTSTRIGKPDFTRNQFGGSIGGPHHRQSPLLLRGIRGAHRAARQDDLDRRA